MASALLIFTKIRCLSHATIVIRVRPTSNPKSKFTHISHFVFAIFTWITTSANSIKALIARTWPLTNMKVLFRPMTN